MVLNMIVRRQKTDNFSIISNEVAKISNISARSKGLYYYLMTLPDDWRVYKEEIYKNFSDTRYALDKSWKELSGLGYIKMVRVKDGSGKITGSEFVVYESVHHNDEIAIDGKNHKMEKPSDGISAATKDLLVTKDLSFTKDKADYKEIKTKWNEFAKKNKLPTINSITSERKNKLKSRLTEKSFSLQTIFLEIERSSFILNDFSGFGFDWIIKNDSNYIKILEGKYRDKNPRQHVIVPEARELKPEPPVEKPKGSFREIMEKYKEEEKDV